jgi:aerobic carbon-monoxide dehydrogenase medium subunit
MKPPQFDYTAPTTVDEVLNSLAASPETTAFLAGGQSLVPLLNMRLARPTLIVDLNRVAGLDLIDVSDGHLRLGPMVRQRALEINPTIRERLPLLTEAARHIAHLAIRTRGTVGGSLAHADPAAELPAVMRALEAQLVLRHTSGYEHTVPADQFFVGPLTTAVQPGEFLCEIDVPIPSPGTGWAFVEVARTHGAFALVGAATLVHLGSNGQIASARLALCGVGGTPHAPGWVDELLVGERPDDSTFDSVAARIAAEIEPQDDIHATGAYRRKVAGVLVKRSLRLAASRAG